MIRFLVLKSQRFRLLLRVEWSILALMVCAEVARGPDIMPRLPLLNLTCLGLYALMGLRFPRDPRHKWLYLVCEVFLLWIASLWGGLRLILPGFVILVMRNCELLDRRHRWWATFVCAGIFGILQSYRQSWLEDLLLFVRTENAHRIMIGMVLINGFSLIFIQLLIDTLLVEHQSRKRLSEANDQIRQYAAQIETLATTQERNRIAREIHDALGHSLTALTTHLEAATKLWTVDPAEAKLLVSEAHQLAHTSLADVRQSVQALRTDPLVGQSLVDALTELIQDVERTCSMQITTDLQLDRPLPAELKIAIYRIVQEALTNVLKHAHATQVQLTLHGASRLEILLRDNGVGFDPSQNTSGFGLQSMRERTFAQQGTFELLTQPHQGCQIKLSFPLQQ